MKTEITRGVMGATEIDHEDWSRMLDAALAMLDQGEALLMELGDEIYRSRVPLAFNASIGCHYRHVLDHFTSLLRGLESDEIDYDHRLRDSRIESHRDSALALTRQIRVQLEKVSSVKRDTPVRTRCEVSYQPGGSLDTHSTFGRELVYTIAHAIHHYALISVMARLLDARLPEQFGVAPSTTAYQAGVQAL